MDIFRSQEVSPATIADRLKRGRAMASSEISDAVLDAQLAALRRMNSWQDDALKPTVALADLIERNIKKLTTPEAQAQLAQCRVFVVPLAFCGVYSESPDTIVVGSGLVDYISAYLYWGALAHGMPESLSEVYDPAFPKTPVRDVVPLLLFGLLYRYIGYGEPFPNYRAVLDDEIDEQVQHSLAGAMTFVLLHELGHLVLNHHADSSGPVRMVDLPFQVPENLSSYKLQELEADDFVRESMIEGYRPIHALWLNTALGPHFMMETLLSQRGVDHPVCVNRLVHAQASANDAVDRAAYLEHLKNSTQRYQSIEAKNSALRQSDQLALLERFSREQLLEQLTRLNRYFGDAGLDLSAMTESTPPAWDRLLARG